MYELRVDKQAPKYLNKLDKPNQKRLMGALIELAENPFADTCVTRMKVIQVRSESVLATSVSFLRSIKAVLFCLFWRWAAAEIFINNRKSPSLHLKRGVLFLYWPIFYLPLTAAIVVQKKSNLGLELVSKPFYHLPIWHLTSVPWNTPIYAESFG